MQINSSPCQLVQSKLFPGIQLQIKRDDLLHPIISGNKFRKLKFLLNSDDRRPVVSMGGAWSNHIHALAYAAHLQGRKAWGLIRTNSQTSDPSAMQDTAMMRDARRWGMNLIIVTRHQYRQLRADQGVWTTLVPNAVGADDAIWIAEGGRQVEAMFGVSDLISELPELPDQLLIACGTGTSLAGLVSGVKNAIPVIGVAALDGAAFLRQDVQTLFCQAGLPSYDNFHLWLDEHCGGYAKVNDELRGFAEEFFIETGIPLDPVYTAKALFALSRYCRAGRHETMNIKSKVLMIHTGGLQGARGIDQWKSGLF